MLESSTVNDIEARDNMIQPEDKIRVNNEKIQFSYTETSRAKSLMLKANEGNERAREDLITVLRPYIEKIVGQIASDNGLGKADKLVQTESEKIIELFLSKDNYQKAHAHAKGDFSSLRKDIYAHTYHQFNFNSRGQEIFSAVKENFYSYMKEGERGRIYDLIQKVNSGDGNAQGELISVIKPHMETVAKNMGLIITGEKISDDLVSEAVTSALYKIFIENRDHSKPFTVNSIQTSAAYYLRNAIVDTGILRQEEKAAEEEFLRQQNPGKQSSFDRGNPSSPERDLIIKQTNTKLRQYVWELPPDNRNVVNDRYLNDQTTNEIAEVKGLEGKHVRYLKKQGLNKLRQPCRKLVDYEELWTPQNHAPISRR